MNLIMGFNPFQLSEDDWISNLKNNPGLAMLLVNGFGKLMLLHNVHNVCYLQENIFCSESKILGLCGDGHQAEAYQIDSDSAASSLDLPVPSWRDLKGAQSAESIDTLGIPDQNPMILCTKFNLFIPPLVLNMILDAKSLVPSVLIPILSSAKFQEYDRTSATIKACTILRPILEFLWAAHHKLDPATVAAVDPSQDAMEWALHHHFACIMDVNILAPLPPFLAPPVPDGLDPNVSLSAVVGHIRMIRDDVAERQLLHDAQGVDSKKENSKGWDKFLDKVHNMILKLSAIQDDILPLEPCESYSKIQKQSKVLGVAMVINVELSLRKIQVEVPTTMANTIKTGNSLLVAHSFSISMFCIWIRQT
jgi:hypothetical protein